VDAASSCFAASIMSVDDGRGCCQDDGDRKIHEDHVLMDDFCDFCVGVAQAD